MSFLRVIACVLLAAGQLAGTEALFQPGCAYIGAGITLIGIGAVAVNFGIVEWREVKVVKSCWKYCSSGCVCWTPPTTKYASCCALTKSEEEALPPPPGYSLSEEPLLPSLDLFRPARCFLQMSQLPAV